MKASGAQNRRQVQASETRQRLFQAACKAFAERGYHQANVADIARAAGVAKGTFFAHFGTKDAVITELVQHQVGSARRARAAALEAGTPVDALIAAVMTLAEEAGRSRGLSRAVLAATLENQQIGTDADALFATIFDEMVTDARAARGRRMLLARRDPEALAHALMASYLGAVLHFASSPSPRALTEVLAPLVDSNLAAFVKEDWHAPSRASDRLARSAARSRRLRGS
jgi:AcrR family transcriptional regulator